MTSAASQNGLSPVTAPAILVVDDNAAKHLSIRASLESLGHAIVAVDSGEAALHAVMDRPFAVILMDVQMPLMDGYETARFIRMRKECEHTPIIFITAHSRDEAHVPTAYASGAVDFMFAPMDPAILRAKVSVFIELFKQAQELEQSLSDVTKLSEQFRDNEARTRTILDHVADGIVTVGDEGRIESFNAAASEIFGYMEAEAIGEPFARMHESKGTQEATELRGRRKDGTTFPMELDMSTVALGSRQIHIGCVRDISDRHAYTARLTHQTLHDSLTGLPNRVLFQDRVELAIRSAIRSSEPLAVLVLDLNEFKLINDTLGHQHGDVLLRLVADRLTEALRDGDTVARLGGDEFGILPIGGTDIAGAASVARTIGKALEKPFEIQGVAYDVRASIGIALVPEHGGSIDDLMRRADLAMYVAKRSGSGYEVFNSEQEDAPARRLALYTALCCCVERGELVLHYQPKVDLDTKETIGVEALIRWNHPSGRLMMPGEFMPEVERSELMIPITEWVVNEALSQLRAWRDAGYDLTMAVNFGARCLAPAANLFQKVDALVEQWGIPPEKLTLELTEAALLDTAAPEVREQLEHMSQRLSIDDFGTGYSSLVYLQRLPVMEIKADRSFVTSMATVPDDAVIVRSTIDLAHNLSVKVVAEGVEDQPTMDQLIAYGCDSAQGYFFSRPLPGPELLEWLETSDHGLPRRLQGQPELAPAGNSVA